MSKKHHLSEYYDTITDIGIGEPISPCSLDGAIVRSDGSAVCKHHEAHENFVKELSELQKRYSCSIEACRDFGLSVRYNPNCRDLIIEDDIESCSFIGEI